MRRALRDGFCDWRRSVKRQRHRVLRLGPTHVEIKKREELHEESFLGLGVVRGDVQHVIDVYVDVVVEPGTRLVLRYPRRYASRLSRPLSARLGSGPNALVNESAYASASTCPNPEPTPLATTLDRVEDGRL